MACIFCTLMWWKVGEKRQYFLYSSGHGFFRVFPLPNYMLFIMNLHVKICALLLWSWVSSTCVYKIRKEFASCMWSRGSNYPLLNASHDETIGQLLTLRCTTSLDSWCEFCVKSCMCCDVLAFAYWFFSYPLGAMQSDLLAEVTDGSSNVREVWKFSFK